MNFQNDEGLRCQCCRASACDMLIRHDFDWQTCSAFLICNRIGRLWATRQLCVVWVLGIAIFMGNKGNLGAVYAGRIIAGLGVEQTAVVGPVSLAEIAPAPIRGICTCVFTVFVYSTLR